MSGTYPTSPATLTGFETSRTLSPRPLEVVMSGYYGEEAGSAAPTTGQLWPRGAGEG